MRVCKKGRHGRQREKNVVLVPVLHAAVLLLTTAGGPEAKRDPIDNNGKIAGRCSRVGVGKVIMICAVS